MTGFNIGRRDFLTSTGALSLALAAGGCEQIL